ncbi:T-complex protein 1 subunit epsilon [Dictyocoela muelleri]|nr:T-complex protein 1 subunit epsilon [Dictyocoela muelleri]
MNSNVIYDDLGRPITISESQSTHLKDSTALTTSLSVMRGITELLKTSLGPCGMDKMIVDQDGEVVVTNDGATILEMMEVSNPVARMVVGLSQAQDYEVGDGTTGVVILATELLEQAVDLINRGMHPLKVIDAFERVSREVQNLYEEMSEEIKFSEVSKVVKTCLDSKIARTSADLISICVDAVSEVADFERGDLDFELVKIEGKVGKDIGATKLIKGVVIDKEFSHPQMRKNVENAKIAILTCPFEPPKMKTKNTINISNAQEYNKLSEFERNKFLEMIDSLKKAKVDVVLCQWGFDDEANSLLMENDLPAVRWVGGPEIEAAALHTGANIISRFEDLRTEDLGMGNIKEISLGTENDKIIVIESNKKYPKPDKDVDKSKTVTILVRGGNEMIVEEIKRCINDALCSIRNILKNPKIVYGGGSAELSAANTLAKSNDEISRAFSRALFKIPMILAENSGLDPYSSLNQLEPYHGIDCLGQGVDMKKNGVMESLISKKQQVKMSVQLVSSILKIDDIIYLGN